MINKKGFAWIPLLIIGFLLVGIFGGWFTAYKLNQTISSIPDWIWWLSIFIIFILITRKKK